MAEYFNENLVVLDEIPWIEHLVAQGLAALNKPFVKVPSSARMSGYLDRFRSAERIIIHWESSHRHGGALIEELIEAEPGFDVSERVIVLTANPTNEDVYYFNELNVKNIIRIAPNRPSLHKATNEMKRIFGRTGGPNKIHQLWQRVLKGIDDAQKAPVSRERLDRLSSALESLHQKSGSQSMATYLEAKASIAYLSDNKSEAERLWRESLEKNPNYFRASQQLLKFFDDERRYADALHLIHNLNKRNKHSIARMVQMGQINRRIKEDQRAEHCFSLALDKDAYCNGALNGLAEIRFDQGQYEEARGLLKRARSSENTASYLNKKGIDLVKKGKYEEALEVYKNAQYVLPSQEKGALLFYNMGLCYSRWGKLGLAQEYLKLALIKQPNYAKAQQLLAKIQIRC